MTSDYKEPVHHGSEVDRLKRRIHEINDDLIEALRERNSGLFRIRQLEGLLRRAQHLVRLYPLFDEIDKALEDEK